MGKYLSQWGGAVGKVLASRWTVLGFTAALAASVLVNGEYPPVTMLALGWSGCHAFVRFALEPMSDRLNEALRASAESWREAHRRLCGRARRLVDINEAIAALAFAKTEEERAEAEGGLVALVKRAESERWLEELP